MRERFRCGAIKVWVRQKSGCDVGAVILQYILFKYILIFLVILKRKLSRLTDFVVGLTFNFLTFLRFLTKSEM